MAGSRVLLMSIFAAVYTRHGHCAELRGSSYKPTCLCLFDLDGTLGHGGNEIAELSNVPAAVQTINECDKAGCELGIITGGDLDTLQLDIAAVLEPTLATVLNYGGESGNTAVLALPTPELGISAKKKLTDIIEGDHTYSVEKSQGWNKPKAIVMLPNFETFDQVILFDDNTSADICKRDEFWSGKYNKCDENAKFCDGGYWWVPAGAGSGIPLNIHHARYSDKHEGLNQCNANQAHVLLQTIDDGSFKYPSNLSVNSNLSVDLFGKVCSKVSDDQFRCEAILECINAPLLPPTPSVPPPSTTAPPSPTQNTCDWQQVNVPCTADTICDAWISENCLGLIPKVHGFCKSNNYCHLNTNA